MRLEALEPTAANEGDILDSIALRSLQQLPKIVVFARFGRECRDRRNSGTAGAARSRKAGP